MQARGAEAATKVKQAPRAAAEREGSDDLLLRNNKLLAHINAHREAWGGRRRLCAEENLAEEN